MILTAGQLVAHAVGDYLLQSDAMALHKRKSKPTCLAHALTYTIPFLFLTLRPWALAFILGTHFVIDHWGLARYVVFAKNFLAPRSQWPRWKDCEATGYHKDRPPWMAVWLLIIADNTLHVLCNALALTYL